jgi:hypothetical protein
MPCDATWTIDAERSARRTAASDASASRLACAVSARDTAVASSRDAGNSFVSGAKT